MSCGSCSPLYTWTPFNDGSNFCFRYNTIEATASETAIPLYNKQDNQYSSSAGTLYTTYDSNGIDIGQTYVLNNLLWKPTIGTDGPLNRTSVWTDWVGTNPQDNTPLNTWLGFSVCLTGETDQPKTYYVGIGANDNYKIDLDGIEIINTFYGPYNGSVQNYVYWHVYPISIPTGKHILEVYGLNTGKTAAFGCEIYDNTFSELTAATTFSDLNIVYSTSGESICMLFKDLMSNYLSSGYTCPIGYFYSECDGECLQQVVCRDFDATQTPTPTPTITPTKTPTPTPSRTVRSRFIRSCCDNTLYRISDESLTFPIGSVISVLPEAFCFTVVSTPNINQPYRNISLSSGYNLHDNCNNGKCQPCPSPTPTPTPSLTPGTSPLPIPIPPQVPVVGQSYNECDVITLLPLGIICNVVEPTIQNPSGGILSVNITGGTAPYTIIWTTPDGSSITGQTIFNQTGGSYNVLVIDKWGDFSASTICSIEPALDCEYEASIYEYILPTPTPTLTPTHTPTPTPTRILIIPPNYTPICLSYNGENCTNACEATCSNYYTTILCEELTIGCSIWTNTTLTNLAPDGYYSDGNNCFTVVGGEITAISTCPVQVAQVRFEVNVIQPDNSSIDNVSPGTPSFYQNMSNGFPPMTINTSPSIGTYRNIPPQTRTIRVFCTLLTFNTYYVTLTTGSYNQTISRAGNGVSEEFVFSSVPINPSVNFTVTLTRI